ncbi:hypothetical protein Acr_05g0004290 [Actinidia rufa]|uniref:Elongator complex protein 5 n=1 Tax=Actinidia rufa TaxID=165716 RepID=A0A7J0EK77_9ERIC|nr:hypothetical protein Acr_05g0004290 [Actinidia rufa]
MAELIRRALRDGALDGEHAPALTIKDNIDSPFGPHVFNHVLAQLSANILAGKSQSQSVSFIFEHQLTFGLQINRVEKTTLLPFKNGLGFWIVTRILLAGRIGLWSVEALTNQSPKASNAVRLCKDVRNLDNLFSSILQLGKELVGQGKGRFSVAIDSATEMIRHASISSLAALLSNIRSHVTALLVCSSFCCQLPADIATVTSVLEYMSSMVASIEPMTRSASGQRGNYENLSLLERNSKTGKFHVRLKRRNGRVRLMSEDFCIEQSGIKFTPRSGDGETISQSLVPKVQFNLQLSEKERIERAKVVLPFEHQGIGKPIEIYDGRQSLNENNIENSSTTEKLPTSQDPGKGEIIYFRDSDDEMPDSDEDPDDDLDI